MTKLASITLKGESGAEYQFNVYPRSDSFKALGAVYFVTKRTVGADGNGTHKWIYVGETGDLSSRPLNHHRKACFDKYSANCVCILADGDHDKRLAIETDLRRNYDPPCNRE